MRNFLKLLMVVGLLALMMPLLFGVVGSVGADSTDIVAQHADSKNIDNGTCNGCHDPNELDPNDSLYPGAHRKHFVSAYLNFYGNPPSDSTGCGKCHDESVFGGGVGEGLGSGYEGDLSYASVETSDVASQYGRSANKLVKADVCENCHGAFITSDAGHAGVAVDDSCATSTCHDGTTGADAATAHLDSSDTINQDHADSPTYCALCHGGNAWYETEESTTTLP